MKMFFMGVLASIIAAIIVSISSKYTNISFLRGIAGVNFFGHGIVNFFNNQKQAEKDLLYNFQNSSIVKVFACRGNSLVQQERNMYKYLKDSTKDTIKILIADPKTKKHRNIEVEKRVNELDNKSLEIYSSEITNVIELLDEMKVNNSVLDFRLHTQPIVFRFFIFEEFLFLSFFLASKPASTVKMLKIKKNSDLYYSFNKYFDRIWEQSKKVIRP